ncbi:PTS system mannose/fructose/sorbose family transporter subunit IID [Desulfoplanes sp.]
MLSREVKIFIRMFARTYFVGGCMNTRGMQNIGLSYAMDPGLRHLYTDKAELQKARKRYLKIYNTHPCWTPLLVGLFYFLEKKIRKGILPPRTLPHMKGTIAYTLSAVGDALFGGSLYVFWSLSTMLLWVCGLTTPAITWAVLLILGMEIFKLYTFCKGVSEGISFLARLRSWNLIDWAARIKMANTGLLVAFWVVVWPTEPAPLVWIAGTGGILLMAWFASLFYRAREVILFVVALGFIIFSRFMQDMAGTPFGLW